MGEKVTVFYGEQWIEMDERIDCGNSSIECESALPNSGGGHVRNASISNAHCNDTVKEGMENIACNTESTGVKACCPNVMCGGEVCLPVTPTTVVGAGFAKMNSNMKHEDDNNGGDFVREIVNLHGIFGDCLDAISKTYADSYEGGSDLMRAKQCITDMVLTDAFAKNGISRMFDNFVEKMNSIC